MKMISSENHSNFGNSSVRDDMQQKSKEKFTVFTLKTKYTSSNQTEFQHR